MYLAYGDTRILEEQYESMKAWVGYIQSVSKNNLWNSGFHFGDWLFYTMDNDVSGRAAVTDKYLIAQCFYAYSTQIMINTAGVLGKTEDRNRYEELLAKIKDAFQKEYVTPNGRLTSHTQTAYTLALHMDMLPESLRAQAADRLAANVKEYGNHLTTGFLGTPYLCSVLSKFGHNDAAYTLLLQESYPSWLYPVKMGATTIWERWNGIKPDSTFETPSMNSFNHYAYGAIGDWLYRVVAGIDTDPLKPGYAAIRIRPKEGEKLSLDVTIPHNTTARVYVPATNENKVTESGTAVSGRKEFKTVGMENGYLVLELGSGSYRFQSDAGQ
jgi:alpha-L-rhamnosidase